MAAKAINAPFVDFLAGEIEKARRRSAEMDFTPGSGAFSSGTRRCSAEMAEHLWLAEQ